MKLLVISHTNHYKDKDGTVRGWGPTVRELNHLANLFSQIIHIAPLVPGVGPPSSLPYRSEVELIPLTPTGGSNFRHKLNILWHAPQTINLVWKYLKLVDYFQFRAPTGIGVYLIPILALISKRGWFKYAGNWVQEHPPLSYRWQRFFLARIIRTKKVTLNGRWKELPSHCIPFENPCLTEDEVRVGIASAKSKDFSSRLSLLFVGRIEAAKGVGKIIQMLSELDVKDASKIEEIVFVGEGAIEAFQAIPLKGIHVRFTGDISRGQLNEIYQKSHVLLLPSASEGFPKVLAESCAYGCVPLVSGVSSIAQYINEENGHIFSRLEPQSMAFEFSQQINNAAALKEKSGAGVKMAAAFTYVAYVERISKEIVTQDH